MNVTHHVSTI